MLNLLATTSHSEPDLLSPRPPTPLRAHYRWEDLNVVPTHVAEQLHNTVIHNTCIYYGIIRKEIHVSVSFIRIVCSDAIIAKPLRIMRHFRRR